MNDNDIKWFLDLIKSDRNNRKSKKRLSEISDLNLKFITNCPSAKGPVTSAKFIDYGFKTGRSFSSLKKRIIDSVPHLSDNYRFLDSSKKLYELKNTIVSLYETRKTPTIFLVHGEFGEIDTLFIRLRNAFAHGNFFKKNDYYIIWNGIDDKEPLKCFMILKYCHLVSIYNCLETLK